MVQENIWYGLIAFSALLVFFIIVFTKIFEKMLYRPEKIVTNGFNEIHQR